VTRAAGLRAVPDSSQSPATDPVDDRVRRGRDRDGTRRLAERPEAVDGSGERTQDLAAARTAREVPEHAIGLSAVELALQMGGETLPRLIATRHPGSHEDLHDRLDAVAGHPDSCYAHDGSRLDADSYDAAMPQDADAELVARARQGDLEAFAELVRRHEHRVRAVLFRLLDDERDVEEATQDAFVQAWRNLESFRGDAAVFTWLYRITLNQALARLRRKRLPLAELDDAAERQIAAPGSEPPDAAETRDLHAFLADRIRELPLDYRAPLVLRDLVGLSNDEVAAILDLSVPAAKSRIHRARMRIREDLERRESERSGDDAS
jgi:RNA polymerase sigma-70 factor, ECF subfamily